MTNVQQISLEKLVNNTGQIAGVPKNPRQIRKEQYDKLLRSLRESDLTDYKPLMVYPLGDKYVCLGGNMRLRALRELKAETVSCIIVPENEPVENLRKLVILDNTEFGEYDWDCLANEWEMDQLADWGVDLHGGEEIDVNKMIDMASSDPAVREYSEDTNYDLKNLYRTKINEQLVEQIETGIRGGQIRAEIADVLMCRAKQCSVFNFDEIIKYYRSTDATDVEKELLRRLYLVFVAPRELFEAEILKITELSNIIYDDELLQAEKAD